ncbi:MAG: oligosaccharide flippase family protein, partial [Marinomonas sp.]
MVRSIFEELASVRILRNTMYSFAGSGFPIIISIITIPFFISQIGMEKYGVLAIGWLLLGYFGAADFGIGRAITQRVAFLSTSDGEAQSKPSIADAIASAIALMLVFSIFTTLALYLLSILYFDLALDVSSALRQEIVSSIWILALGNPLVALFAILSGSLMGLERFRLVAISNTISNSALLILPLMVAVWITVDLFWLLAAALVARLIGVCILATGVWAAFFRGQSWRVSKPEMRKLTGYGKWIMLSALVGPLMVISDRFLIGFLENAIAVAAYAVPFQIASRTMLLPVSLAQALFPRLTAEVLDKAILLNRRLTVFVGQAFAPIVVGLICIAEPLLDFWLGTQLDSRSIDVAQIVLVGFWFNAIAHVPYMFVQARGDSRFTGLLHLGELPIYLLLLTFFGLQFGLQGFAMAFAIRCLLDCLALMHRTGELRLQALRALLFPGVLIGAAIFAGMIFTSWVYLIVAGTFLTSAALAGLICILPNEVRSLSVSKDRALAALV